MKARLIQAAAAIAGVLASVAPLVAQQGIYTRGHMDLGIRYDSVSGTLLGIWKNDAAIVDGVVASEATFEAGEIRAVGIYNAATPPLTRPAGSQWDFLGVAAGAPIYIFPASGVPNTLPHLGISTEDPSLAGFSGDLSFTLLGIAGPNGSTFTAFSSPQDVRMIGTNSSTGGALSLAAGNHLHYNISFSNIGVYDVTFLLSGTLDGVVRAGAATFRMEVVPEPSVVILIALAVATALILRRRRAMPTAGQ